MRNDMSSSRHARALAALAAGRLVLVGDEAHPGGAGLLALSKRASAATLRQLEADGRRAELVAAVAGGTLVRHDATAAAGDLAVAADDGPALFAAVELPGGLLARDGEAERFADARQVTFVTVEDVVAHRLRTEQVMEEVAVADLPSAYAPGLRVHALRRRDDGSEHLALVRRPPSGFGPEPLVRLHSECLTGDALGSLRCDCGEQLRRALSRVAADPQGGAVLYLRGQEGRGIGLANKIRAYALQDRGLDTVEANLELGFPADARDYRVAVAMLNLIGIPRLRLLSNNPAKSAALERYGIDVVERRGLRIGPNPHNAAYLDTKRQRMGHDLDPGRPPQD